MKILHNLLGRLVPHGIRGTLILLLLVVLVPVLFVQAGIYYNRFQERSNHELLANLELARSVATTFDNYVRDIAREELAIGIALSSPQAMEDTQVRKLLAASAGSYQSILNVSWVDPQGRTIASSEPAAVGMDLADRAYFREIASGREWAVGDLVKGKALGELGFNVARGTRDGSGTLLGVVVAFVDPGNLAETLTVERSGQGAIAIVDRQGNIVYRYPEAAWVGESGSSFESRSPGYASLSRPTAAGEEVAGTMTSAADGRKRVMGMAPIRSIGWQAVASRPEDEAIGPVVEDLLRDSALLSFVTVAAFAVALALGHELTVPLVRLREQTLAIGRGELDRPVRVSGLAELKAVALAFNSMAEQIRVHESEPDGYVDTLKRSEEERERLLTDLRRVNSQLTSSNLDARTQAEVAEWRAAELNAVFSAMTDGVVIYDATGNPAHGNDAAVAIYGLDPDSPDYETLVKQRQIRHPDGRPCTESEKPSVRALRGETIVGERYVLTSPQGRDLTISVSAAPLRKDGKITGAISVLHDITERERLLEHLRFLAETGGVLTSSLDLDATLHSIAQLAVPALADWCVVDVVGDDTSVHHTAVAHAGLANDDLAHEIERHYPAGPTTSRRFSEALRTGKPVLVAEVTDSLMADEAFDAEHLRAIRELGPKSYLIVPFVVRQSTVGAIALIYTSSGRRYAAEDLLLAEEFAHRAALAIDNARLYQQARTAIGLRDDFLTVAAHELKTPLTALLGYTQLTIRQFARHGTLDPQQLQSHLQVMEQQSKKLATLVSQLLDVSRLEAKSLSLDRTVADVRELAEEVVERSRSIGGHHEFVVRATGPAPAAIDALRVEQILLNLVDNAIKYSPAGGKIDVEVATQEPGTVRIAVRDQGVGVPPEHRQRIFDRFYQAHSHARFGGMGLGLFISRQIAELHGGALVAEFPPDGGSRFVLTLPVNMEARSNPMI